MRELEKKRQRIYYLLNAANKLKILYFPYTKQITFFFFYRKRAFNEKEEWRIEQKKKKKWKESD